MRHRLMGSALVITLSAFSCAEGTTTAPDRDGDGFGSNVDCNDADPEVNPDATEVCDSIDNDCDGEVDEEASDRGTFYEDADGDDYGVADSTILACDKPDGFSAQKGDCNDAAPNVHPGAEEDCEQDIDKNCDGSTGYADMDMDGFPACLECDDGDETVNPDATEVCDGIDNDCDGATDTDDIPLDELCGTVDNGMPACDPAEGCVVAGCDMDWYDVNGDFADGCECQADPLPVTAGDSCANAIDLGQLFDDMADLVTVTGNAAPAGREVWYRFEAIDDIDTTGDEFHVDVRFSNNPGDAYQIDVFRGGCPTDSGEQVAMGEIDVFDWYTDQNFTSTGCDGPAPCGEGDCTTVAGAPGKNKCDDDTAFFYVKITRIDAMASCDSYAIELSNGVH